MSAFLIYGIKVNIAIGLFYLLYLLFLRKDTFLHIRRLFFLSAVFFSLLYPLFTVSVLGDLPFLNSRPVQTTVTVLVGDVAATGVMEETALAFVISWREMVPALLLPVTLFFAFRFIWQLVAIIRLRMRSEGRVMDGVVVYQFRERLTPFSFFGWIFIHIEQHTEEELRQILLHEQVHVRQWHSADILLMELLCVLFWWNPFVWLMKREMAVNLEYLADQGVLRRGIDSRDYQYHLLRLTYQKTAVQIVNNFNVSQLKQRIMMMNQTKSPGRKLAKYLLMLPLILVLITANSLYAQQQEPQKKKQNKTAQSEKQPQEADTDGVFIVVENQPEFPGGPAEMMKFLSDNIQYPVEAQKKGIQGRVVCNFVVEKDGSLSNFKVVRGVDPLLDAEAVRVLSAMPKWKPGTQRGKAVRVRYTVPVFFRLQENDEAKTAAVETNQIEEGRVQKYFKADKAPEFPGGEQAFFQFLSERIRYPVKAQENHIQGSVVVSYTIDKTGKVTEVSVKSNADPLLAKEAVRVIGEMPDWTPGMSKNKPVSVIQKQYFLFRLEGEGVSSLPPAPPAPDDAIVVVGYAGKNNAPFRSDRL